MRQSERTDDPTLDSSLMDDTQSDEWTEGHLLVLAAHQLDRWARRLDEVSRSHVEEAPVENKLLNDLRNALEHLHEAGFEDGVPTRPLSDRNRRRWALEELPHHPGSGTHDDENGHLLALGLLDLDHIEQTARRIANEIIEEIEAPAVDAYLQAQIDQQRGK